MASSTVALKYDASNTVTFELVSTSSTGAKWKVGSRSLSAPYSVEIIRKENSSGALANDHIILRMSRTEINATSGKPATLSATLDISIPKDQTILDMTAQKQLLKLFGDIPNDGGAMSATYNLVTAILEGRDM